MTDFATSVQLAMNTCWSLYYIVEQNLVGISAVVFVVKFHRRLEMFVTRHGRNVKT